MKHDTIQRIELSRASLDRMALPGPRGGPIEMQIEDIGTVQIVLTDDAIGMVRHGSPNITVGDSSDTND